MSKQNETSDNPQIGNSSLGVVMWRYLSGQFIRDWVKQKKASAHRLRDEKIFRAFDIRDKKVKGEEKVFYNIVKNNPLKYYNLGLRRMEDVSITIGWGHLDTLNKNCKPNSIRVIDKTKCTETIYF